MNQISKELRNLADAKQALNLARFFKTGKGQYGEGDLFLGIKVPVTRSLVAKYYKSTDLLTVKELLHSKYHEERLCALLLLVKKYEKSHNEDEQRTYFDLYLQNTNFINNWDLVDLSAPNIVGNYLFNIEKDENLLFKLAKSDLIWDRRIAVLASFYYIRQKSFDLTIKLSDMLLTDKHDLMHKAIGWMLREVGKRDKAVLLKYLHEHYRQLPRTTLRYAIEHFDLDEKKFFMQK
jgi:3-methyladenine DNA glycosylase AlkD